MISIFTGRDIERKPLGLEFDKERLTKLSSECLNALRRLRDLAELSPEDFQADPYKVAAAKYFLVVSIEAAIDMGNHVISLNKLRVPEDYAETFEIVGEVGRFPGEFIEKLKRMARFRNRLVHIYWEVDQAMLYEILSEDIRDIEEFMRRFSDILSSEEG
ncbi:DUF86 domain-containing protein [Dehalococcoidia bacterium]|nr:DUF86 domain-containing protein [Dehalococcoidia bacterium]